MINPELIAHRQASKKAAAVVFVHGFGGHPQSTWGLFPELVCSHHNLRSWGVFSVGYPTSIWLDLAGIWKADPPLESLADGLRTQASLEPLADYESVAFVAHSMGGLIVQRALVDDAEFADRVQQVVLFGTPSGGLAKAHFGKYWKRSVRAMAKNGSFVSDLRARWTDRFAKKRPFTLLAVAGDQDEFVPRDSSVEPFPTEQRRVIRGDHLSIVKPLDRTAPSFQLVVSLLGGASETFVDSATAVAEHRRARAIVKRLDGQHDLDEGALVELALSLEHVDRQDEAIATLEAQMQDEFIDARGTLAGRYKRRWFLHRRMTDAKRAHETYLEAYELAVRNTHFDGILYAGINLAFLELARRQDLAAARLRAKEMIDTLRRGNTRHAKWALATEAEARLILGETKKAAECYRKALAVGDSLSRFDAQRQALSMYQQAMRVTTALGDRDAGASIEKAFREAFRRADI